MRLKCPDCGADVSAEDVNIATGLAKCRACNAVWNAAATVAPAAPGPRPRVPQPSSITVEDLGTGVRLTRRWIFWGVLFLTGFCLFWDGVLVLWYWSALAGDRGAAANSFSFCMVLFPLFHVAIGVSLTYYTLACYLNRTVIEVNEGRLMVRHGPLPWPGSRDIDVSELEQLYCEETISRGRQGSASYTYGVSAVLKGGRKVKLLVGLRDKDHALFIEQLVEQYLGIEDRPVPGELPR